MVTTIWGGLSVGAVYALIALGYSLSRATSGALNFATAHLMMLAAFVGIWALEMNIPLPLAILISGAAGAACAAVEERLAIRPLKSRLADSELITTIGASTVFAGIITVVWGSDLRAVRLGPGLSSPFSLLGGRMLPVDAILIVLAVIATLAYWLWSTRFGAGLRSRAQTEDREAAVLRGINVRVMSLVGFTACGAALGLLAPIIASKTFASATLPNTIAIMAFVALTLGGVTSAWGSLIGGLALGLIQGFTASLLGGLWTNIVPFLLFVLILVIRPQGLLGRTSARTV